MIGRGPQQDLFTVRPPDIRTPAPAAPGSPSSRRGARAIEPKRPTQYQRILQALFTAGGAMTREQLADATGIKESSLCGRLSELEPLWVVSSDQALTSTAGVLVKAYQLTAAGRACVVTNAEVRRGAAMTPGVKEGHA